MAGRKGKSEIQVGITADADFSDARKDIKRDLDQIERAAKSTADGIDDAFRKLSPELQTDDIRRALDLAGQLDGMVASFTVDTDLSEIQEAEKLARSLRQFQGRVDLSVEGRAELKDALGLAEKLDQLRSVKVQVQGREDLAKAEAIVRDLDGTSVNVDVKVDDSELSGLGDKFAGAGSAAADAFGGGFDPSNVGATVSEGVLGAVGSAGPWAAAAVGLGSIFAESFASGFSRGFSGSARSDLILKIRGDLSGAQMQEVGEAGAEAYNDGFGESLQGVKETAALIEAELSDIDPQMDLTEITRQAEALATLFNVDVATAVTSVDKLVSQGLVRNSAEGFALLFDLGQQTGTQFEEMLELTDEFSVALKALGIEGAQGLGLIADMVEQGIFPQVDQAGEVFEELNETIIGGGAAEGLERIGLNAAEMQSRIAGGGEGAATAVAEIATAILAMDDNAAQAEATTAIFGSNMGLLGDEAREAALQLFTTVDASREVSDGLAESADQLEAAQSQWDQMSKRVEAFAALMGNEVAARFNDAVEAITQLGDGATWLGDKLGLVEDSASKVGQAMERGGGGGREFAEGTAAAADAVDELDVALQRLTGQYDTDQLMRRFQEDVESARAAAQGLTGDAYTLGEGFDITTEAGRSAEAAMEDVGRSLIDMAQAHRDGSVSTAELAAKQREARQTLVEIAGQMDLTEAATQELINKYGTVPGFTRTLAIFDQNKALQDRGQWVESINGIPPKVTTTASFSAWNAIQNVNNYVASLMGIPSSRSTTVTQTTVRRVVDPDRRALGGPVKAGEPYIVGEEGQELFVPREDGTIIPNGGGGSAAPFAGGAPASGGHTVIELRSSGSAVDDFLVELLRKAIANRGGLDVVFRR